MSAGNVVRITVVLAAVVAAAGSATSSSNDANKNNGYAGAQNAPSAPPPPQQMEPARALGLWRSTFGAVKIEADNSKGGLATGAVQGVWVYQRQGQEVVGYFAGNLRGNVLDFRWQEPNQPPLMGSGYLVFDPQGRQYSGRWWSDRKDRIGDWNGWRQGPAQNAGSTYGQPGFGAQSDPYGGQAYGNANPYGGQNGAYGGAAYGYQQPQPQPYYPQQPPRQPQPQPYYPQQPPRQPQPYYPQQRQPQPYYPQRQPQPQPYYPSQPPPPSQPQQPQSPPYGY